MILTDYFRSSHDLTWDIALECGVDKGVIRLPETEDFDLTNYSHWEKVYNNFTNFGITPILIEPMPNCVHDHIKMGDEKRDESIEKVIKMFPIMQKLNISGICFNFMAYIGWLRTKKDIIERGGAKVTGFNLKDFSMETPIITEKQMWDNYEYFIKAVLPYAEKYNVKLMLHPDDPPLQKLGNVSRIMISKQNIHRAIYEVVKSDNLGITMCQATYKMMGEDVYKVIKDFKDKIMFVHFRNCIGEKTNFRETFHDNGCIDMAEIMKCYYDNGINVPIRVDHVPTLVSENSEVAGYDALGRLFAIGYLKGILQTTELNRK